MFHNRSDDFYASITRCIYTENNNNKNKKKCKKICVYIFMQLKHSTKFVLKFKRCIHAENFNLLSELMKLSKTENQNGMKL